MLPFLIPLATTLASEFLPDMVRGLAGAKAGEVAEKIVGVATDLTGKKEPGDIVEALRADPKLVFELQMALANERLEIARLDAADRASARQMAMKSQLHTWAAITVSVLVTLGFGMVLWAVLTKPVPEASAEVAYVLLGTLATGFVQVVNFWLGSSRSSQDTTQQLADAARGGSARRAA
jgi:hypothetical protein